MLANLAMFPLKESSIVRSTLKKFIGLGPIALFKNSESVLFKHLKQSYFLDVYLIIYLIVFDKLRYQ